MISAVAKILKTKVGEQNWIERFGALVVPGVRPKYITGKQGEAIKDGSQVFPIACEVNVDKCWENGTYKLFCPDTSVASVGFFTDTNGCSLRQITGPKRNILLFNFELRFLCWVNLPRLNVTDCDFTGRAVPHLIAGFTGDHDTAGIFEGGIEEDIYQNLTVTAVRQLPKSPSMFEPFTFAREGDARGLFLYPYDYFGLSITGTFEVNRLCLPDLFPDGLEFIDGQFCKPQ